MVFARPDDLRLVGDHTLEGFAARVDSRTRRLVARDRCRSPVLSARRGSSARAQWLFTSHEARVLPYYDEVIHSILDVMYADAPYTVIRRAVHIHPTVAELIPTMLADLKPLEGSE